MGLNELAGCFAVGGTAILTGYLAAVYFNEGIRRLVKAQLIEEQGAMPRQGIWMPCR